MVRPDQANNHDHGNAGWHVVSLPLGAPGVRGSPTKVHYAGPRGAARELLQAAGLAAAQRDRVE
jgi:hypothetical protein